MDFPRTVPVPEHLSPVAGSAEWMLWRRFVVRGAGFPADRVLQVASADAAEAADACIEADRDVERAQRAATRHVQRALDAMRADGKWQTPEAKALVSLQRAVHKGGIPAGTADPALVALVAAADDARQRRTEARDRYAARFHAGTRAIGRAIRAAAAEPLFQQAIAWQNRKALHTAVLPLLAAADGASNSSIRQKEELVANYLQRYCVKNDTIGFFGPSCWGHLEDAGPGVAMAAGPGLLATRGVYFESWGIEALAQIIEREPGVRGWLAPRLRSRLEGTRLHDRGGARNVPEGDAALLRRCDGSRAAIELARELVAEGCHGFGDEGQVHARLEAYQRDGTVSWGFEIPLAPHSERVFREQLDRIGDESLRASARSRLDELDAARTRVADAGQDAAALDRSLQELEAAFTRLTDAASTRAAGRTYAGRTLVYEDCSRALDLRFGPAVREALDPPLELLLHGARWFVHHFALEARAVLESCYRELAAKGGSAEVDLASYWYRLMPLLLKQDTLLEGTIAEYRRRWSGILAAGEADGPIERSVASIRGRVLEAFSAPPAGYEIARFHSPDLMLAADGVDAILRGDFKLVMGEMHLATNTLNSWVFLAEYGDREVVAGHIDQDLGPRVITMPPKQWPGLTTRCQTAYFSAKDRMLGYWIPLPGIASPTVLSAGQLVLVDRGAGLRVASRDGTLDMDVLEVFGPNLTHNLGGTFEYIDAGAHTPRITLDRLVIGREAWRLQAGDLAFAFESDPSRRFLMARALMQSSGMPRFVFAKAPAEKKPVYVDFASPTYVDLFARVVRRSFEADAGSSIRITEMLPSPEQLWVADAEGARYTCEFRLAALEARS